MGTYCAPLEADLLFFILLWKRFHDNQADVIEAFISMSKYLELFSFDTPYFEGMVNQIYPPELQLYKAINSVTQAPFLFHIYLFLMTLLPPTFMINTMNLILVL